MPIGEEQPWINARRALDIQIELTKKSTSNLPIDVLDLYLYDAATSNTKFHQWGSIWESTKPGSGEVVPGSPETLLSLVKATGLGLFYAVRAKKTKKKHTHTHPKFANVTCYTAHSHVGCKTRWWGRKTQRNGHHWTQSQRNF